MECGLALYRTERLSRCGCDSDPESDTSVFQGNNIWAILPSEKRLLKTPGRILRTVASRQPMDKVNAASKF
jgi:hypothetical protein